VILDNRNPEDVVQIGERILGRVAQMAQHKFASNVVEKCLRQCPEGLLARLIDEVTLAPANPLTTNGEPLQVP
jgi:pumilio RNA-binding family